MEEVSSDKYTDEDKGAQKDVFSGKIDEITTIEDLGSVINGAAAASSYNKDNAEANNFVFLKNYAFNEVQDALESVQGFEDELEDDPTLEAKLKNWGVDSTALPSGIAEEHFKTISAATEIEWVPTKGTDPQHTDLGRAGATAVKGAIQNIKDTVVDSVKEKYHKEINESAALAGSDTTKTALLGVVDTAISNFVTEDKSTTASETAFSLTQYVGTEVEITWIDTEKGNTIKDANRNSIGLIGYVEYCLAKPVNGSTNTAFANERLQKARSEANATLKAKKDEITDSTFKTLTSYKKVKINNADTVTIANKEVGKGTVTKTVDNPFFKSPTVDETNKVVTTGGLVTVTESGVEVDPDVTLLTGATFNLDDYYTALTKETVTQEGFGTLYIQEWANGHLNDFEAIYFAGLDYLHTKLTGASAAPTGTTTTGNTGVKGAVNLSGLPGTYALKADGTGYELVEPEEDYDYVGADAIIGEDDGKWTALDITVETDSPDYNDAGEIATYADGIADNLDSLVALNNGFKTWYKGKVTFEAPATAAEDAKFKTHFEGGETVSSLRKEFNAKLDAAMKGELSESAAKSWTREANLDKLYEADVAAYLEVAKDIALERKQEAASQTTNVEDKLKVEAKYAKFVEAIGKYVVASDNYDVTDPTTWKLADKKPSDPIKLKHDYTCKSITTVDAWLASVVVNLNA